MLLRNSFALQTMMMMHRKQSPRNFFLLALLVMIGQLVHAQQNLFNIPSGDITQKGKIFYQNQFNVYSNKLESKGHFVYGLGKGWEIGANLVGKGFFYGPQWRVLHNDNPGKGALYPILMGTAQKQFHLNKHWSMNVGTQMGINLSNQLRNKTLNHFTYGLATYHHKGIKLVSGLYATNEFFVGDGRLYGIIAGYEIQLNDRWYLMGDWISGDNETSVAVLGAMYNLTKRIQLCAGWQIPNINSPKPQGLVLEINLLSWDAFDN